MSLKISNSSYTIPEDLTKNTHIENITSNTPAYESSLSLTPISTYESKEDDSVSETSETQPDDTDSVQNPDINSDTIKIVPEVLSEENENDTEVPIQDNSINASESSVSDNREYYVRVARTLIILLVTILFIYFVNWLLVNVFKIDVYQMLKDKMMTIPVLGSICATIAASSWFKNSDSDSEQSSNILESTNSESIPVNISKDADIDTLEETIAEDDTVDPEQQMSENSYSQPDSQPEQDLSGSQMKQVLSESIEKSLVDLLTQFK